MSGRVQRAMDAATAAYEAILVENERLLADAERSEKHRNNLFDRVVSLRTDVAALRAENERLASKISDLEADLHDEETRVRHYRELCEGLRAALGRTHYALTKSSFSEAEAVSEAKRIVRDALSEAQP